jgi:AhpD family alkylhydroperoxidase
MPSATEVSAGGDASLDRRPRTFASPREALEDLTGVVLRTRALASAYLRGRLDPELRERVMVAVSRANACRGCTLAHERWAIRAGVTDEELKAIGFGDLAALDDRSRAAIVYATALAETRFRGPVPTDLAAAVGDRLTAPELAAVEAVARAMSLANLSASTAESLIDRLRSGREH